MKQTLADALRSATEAARALLLGKRQKVQTTIADSAHQQRFPITSRIELPKR